MLHKIEPTLPDDAEIVGKTVNGSVNGERRAQLQAHHTGTHIMFASCRKVLGPHVWQAGAKKTTKKAHLDITHYQSLTREQEQEIENTANRLINAGHNISKGFMDKAEAERQYGFSLYQGGVVPGNSLRVVNIEGVDTEACCGTHADNTAEVGWMRILRSSRISDGIVRLEYVAKERAIEVMNSEAAILEDLCEAWGVNQEQIKDTALRFFHDSKRLKSQNEAQEKQILELQVKSALRDGTNTTFFSLSDQDSPTLYISYLPQFAEEFKNSGKGIVFCGKTFVVGLFGNPDSIQLGSIEEQCAAMSTKPIKKNIKDKATFKFKEKGKKPLNVSGISNFMITGADFDTGRLAELFESQ